MQMEFNQNFYFTLISQATIKKYLNCNSVDQCATLNDCKKIRTYNNKKDFYETNEVIRYVTRD